ALLVYAVITLGKLYSLQNLGSPGILDHITHSWRKVPLPLWLIHAKSLRRMGVIRLIESHGGLSMDYREAFLRHHFYEPVIIADESPAFLLRGPGPRQFNAISAL